jgi:nitrous oxidase accessory protein
VFRLKLIAIAILAVFLSASAFAGTTYAVGTCLPTLPFYTTIQEAVSSVPSGSTIKVCPGSYPEQVLITQPLTLEGVPNGSGGAVVVAPTGGLTQTVYTNGLESVACQILVQSTGPVNITNLAVDGTGAIANNAKFIAGVVYEDSAGTVSYVSARNQTNTGFGIGILALTTASAAETVTIEDSDVHGFDFYGILAASASGVLTANVKSNTISGAPGASTGVASTQSNGNVGNGTIESNAISDVNLGVFLFYSGATVTANTISVISPVTSDGIQIVGGSNSVTNNRINAGGGVGVSLHNTATGSLVQKNTIQNSSTAVFGCSTFGINGAGASGFTVSGNTITGAAIGLQMPAGNTSTPNKYYATSTAVQECP